MKPLLKYDKLKNYRININFGYYFVYLNVRFNEYLMLYIYNK